MSMAWVPGCRRHMCPKAPRRSLRIVVVSGGCPVRENIDVDNTIVSMFYKSCIQSVLTFSFICWFGNVSQKDKNNLQRIVNISSKVTGVTQSTLTALYEKQVVNKATRILADDTHVLHADYILLPSSRRFRSVTCKTNRKRFSFVPMSIRLLNDKYLGHCF